MSLISSRSVQNDLNQSRWPAGGLLLLALAFNLYFLWPEVIQTAPRLNDAVLHGQALQGTAAALAQGRSPTDFWLSTIGLGYAFPHHYQHLAYLPLSLLSFLSGGALPLAGLLNVAVYLLLGGWPLSIFWSMRRLGFERLPAALAGLVASLLATNGLLGFEFGSYVWRGSGLYTQLWGMVWLPPALAQGFTTLRTGRGYALSALLLAVVLLGHLVIGYIAVVSLAVLALLLAFSTPERWAPLRRLLGLLVLLALVTAYFWLPYVLDGAYMNRSVWEEAAKYDSYGHEWILPALIRGELFDFGRAPVLTGLAGLGLLICIGRWRDLRHRIPPVLALLWLLLYLGRPTWGPLLDLLPFSRDLHFHRLIAGLHLAGIYLIGLGLAWPVAWLARLRPPAGWIGGLLIAGLLLAPAYQERAAYLDQNRRWIAESKAAYALETGDLAELLATLDSLPPGRVYAGLGSNWGRGYTVGGAPMYGLLADAGLENLGYLYHAMALTADVQVLFDDTNPVHYALFNVRYLVAPVDRPAPPFARLCGQFGRHCLYTVETGGYFDLVNSDVAFTGVKHDFYPAAATWLNSALPAAGQHPAVFLTSTSSLLSRLPLSQAPQILLDLEAPPAPSGAVVAEQITADRYTADIQAAQPATLLLKVTYHPGWQATVDGAPVETRMVLPGFMGIKVPSGAHRVAFTYRPSPGRTPLLLGGLALLLLAAAVECYPSWWPLRLNFSTPAAWWDRARAALKTYRLHLGLYLVLAGLYLACTTGHFASTDHVSVYLTTQSLVEDRDLSIKPIHDTAVGAGGQSYGVFGLGQSIVSIPLYLLGRLVERTASSDLQAYFSGPDLGDWGGTVPIFFVSLLNQLVSPLIGVLTYSFGLRLGFSPRRAMAVTLMLGLGTAIWVYAREYFQHPLETLSLLLAIYVLFAHRDRLRPRHALGAGLALAMGLLIRINLLLAVPAVAAYLLYLGWRAAPPPGHRQEPGQAPVTSGAISNDASALPQGRGIIALLTDARQGRMRVALLHLLALLLPIAGGLALVFTINQIRYGPALAAAGSPSWFRSLIADSSWRVARVGWSNPLWLGLYANLFSPGRSMFLYSPPILLALFAWGRFYRRWRAEAILFGALMMLYLLPYSVYGHWHGGWAWGPRLLLPTLPFLLLVAGTFMNSRRRWGLAILLAGLGIGIQILGVAINYSYVHWDWSRLGLSLENPDYLFVPQISPIPTHLQALLAGRYVDLWLVWVGQQYGVPVLIVSALIPLLCLGCGLALLKPLTARS